MIGSLVQSKIIIMNQIEGCDNVLGNKFCGDFLNIWQNLEQVDETEIGADFFPMIQRPIGIMQISLLYETLLKKECIENEVQLKRIKS